jgi:hypothetical protein
MSNISCSWNVGKIDISFLFSTKTYYVGFIALIFCGKYFVEKTDKRSASQEKKSSSICFLCQNIINRRFRWKNASQYTFFNHLLILYCSTECARDRGPYEVKNASHETQMHAGRVKYAVLETRMSTGRWARALNFGEFSGLNSIKKHG